MTKDEIKALISAKVAGQGDQVDAGGALAQILNGIIDAIPESNEFVPLVDITGLGDLSRMVNISTALSDELQRNVAIKCIYFGETITLLKVLDDALKQALTELFRESWRLGKIYAVFGRSYHLEDGTIDTMLAAVLYEEEEGDIMIHFSEI